MTNLSVIAKESIEFNAVGAVAYHQPVQAFYGSLLQDFEMLVIIVCERKDDWCEVRHSICGEQRYQVMYVSTSYIETGMIQGGCHSLFRYIAEGDILWQADQQIERIRERVAVFTDQQKEKRLLKEFACFLYYYVEGKRYLAEGDVVDAYHNVLESLGHWAKIELIERGIRPEDGVWAQVRGLNRGVYKLYEELTISTETLSQRVELVLLACEFSVMSKMGECTALLLRILRSRREPWSIEELTMHPELQHISVGLPLVIRKLVYRSLVKELPRWKMSSYEGRELCYIVD
ncbi:nucleotidyltransferase-like protein [Paenibacillus lacisoli]|uniref:nucleotidyltransferase-like protein n=1 Tax=Paenibacillus lacisoli TaxID=3064525 RepID=UPI00272B9CFE|nr:nucleotidyltransferase-like protein [Paenibacillus sp. JX-17]